MNNLIDFITNPLLTMTVFVELTLKKLQYENFVLFPKVDAIHIRGVVNYPVDDQ